MVQTRSIPHWLTPVTSSVHYPPTPCRRPSEYTRECLAIEAGASLRSQDVILTLSRLMRLYGKPAFVRSDYGAEFTLPR